MDRAAYLRTRLRVPQKDGRPTGVPPRYRRFKDPGGFELTECLLCGGIQEGYGGHEPGCDQEYINLLTSTIRRLL